jgi:O-antigen/teichoic acid export membrane protein
LLLGVALVWWLGKNAEYPLLAQAAGIAISIVLGYLLLVKILPVQQAADGGAVSKESEGIPSYFFLSLIALAAFSFLMNGDMLMVKHFFSPETAGNYAQISTIARTIVFLPMPIAGALFPKVVSEGAITQYDVKLLVKAIVFASIIIALAAGLAALVPWLPLKILYPATSPAAELLKAISYAVWAMAPLAMVYILLNFELAQKRFLITAILIFAGMVFGLGIYFFHNTIFNVIASLAIANLLALIAIIAIVIRENKKSVVSQK